MFCTSPVTQPLVLAVWRRNLFENNRLEGHEDNIKMEPRVRKIEL